MQDVWHDSLMTGDQCAICEGPVGDDAVTMQDQDGALLRVCKTCALQQAKGAASPAPDAAESPLEPAASVLETPAQALRALQAIRERRADEHAVLAAVAQLVDRLGGDLTEWQTRATTYEQHARSLEAELTRTRERLHRAEELLATCAPVGPGGPEAVPASAPATITSPSAYPPEAPLSLEEVRLAQRYFNDGAHIEKLSSVRRSLGRPMVNVIRLAGAIPRLLVTVAWEIVWYQYVVDLGTEITDDDRVTLYAEGMELSELLDHYKGPNADLDDQGRLDASELEVSLLSGESALLTEMTAEQEQAFEDATEEIWDRHSMPEFRWDD